MRRRRDRKSAVPLWIAVAATIAGLMSFGAWWQRTRSGGPIRSWRPAVPPTSVRPAKPPAATAANPPERAPVTPAPATPETQSSPLPTSPPPDPRVWAAPAVGPVLIAQLALDQRAISCGSIDGVPGEQTASAIVAFQNQNGLEATGRLDAETVAALTLDRPALIHCTVSAEDLQRLRAPCTTWLAKSQADRLEYTTLIELVAERFHCHPRLLLSLNPGVSWPALKPGADVLAPDAGYPPPRAAALVRVSLSGRWVRAFDDHGNLLAHFPCSIGRIAEKRPVGKLAVSTLVANPDYTFNPAVFPESAEAQAIGRKLRIPPGPRNPVGVAWIGLDRPGYGLHGTPAPEAVGRTESHGCFRLANWNADYLRRLLRVGAPVWIDP